MTLPGTAPLLPTLGDRLGRRVVALSNRSFGLVIFAVLLVLYVATGNYDANLQSPDAVAAALPAWHLVNAHSLFLDNVSIHNIWVIRSGSHLVSNRQPGVIFFAVPFYWIFGQGAAFSMFPAVVAAASAAAGAVALLTTTLRGLVGTRLALISGGVLAFGTSTWSVSADTLWPHGPDQLFLAAAIFFLARKNLTLASIAIALAVPVRAHLAVLALVAGIWYACRRRSIWPMITFGIPSLLAVGAVAAYNHWMFGAWSLGGGYNTYVTRDAMTLGNGANTTGLPANIVGSLFSFDHGIVVWFPVLVLVAIRLRAAWRAAPDWVRISSVAGVLYFLVQMKLNFFSGGDRFWSYRLTIEPLTLNVPLLTLAARDLSARHRRVTRVAVAAAIYSIGAQAIGAIYYSPPNIAYDPWTHSKLWAVLSSHAPGPLFVAALTVLALIAALFWPRRRATARPAGEDSVPSQPLESPTQA